MGIDRNVFAAGKTFAALTALGLVLAGCSFGPDEPETVAGKFAEALNNDDIAAAAALTDDPAAATAALGPLYESLGKEQTYTVKSVDDDTFTLDAVWKLGPRQQDSWQFGTTGTAAETDEGWRIHWNPITVAPGLDLGPLSYSPVYPEPAARVLDTTGAEVLTEQTVTLVQLAPGADTPAAAGLLAPVARDISAAALESDLAAAQGKPITALALRESDIAPIREQLTATRGVTLAPQKRLLTASRELSSAALSGLSELWQQQADAAAGWAVRARTATGTQRIAGAEATPVIDIRTTLDLPLQRAAEAALDPLSTAAALVAVRPSTGEVLSIAQNAAADGSGPIALTGLYPPGSTFKTVTAAAALEAGAATPDTVLPCPGVADIEGRRIPNDENFDLGDVPLHTAFARSCNTTMARLAVGLPAEALRGTAEKLGLGVDYLAPGMTTVTGKVPDTPEPAQRVEAAIGQGQVTASPFGMALVAASVAHGSTPAPTLVAGSPGTPDRTPAPLPAPVTEQLKTLMRETITAGTATQLNDIPGLLGKTGTAEYGDNTHAHGWFIAIQDDLALAVFVEDAGSSAPAVEAAGRFLRTPH